MAASNNYSQAQKVAILMLALGKEVAGDLLRQLPARDVQRISRALAAIGRVDQVTVADVIAEFSKQLRSQGKLSLEGGPDVTLQILAKAFRHDHNLSSSLGMQTPVTLSALDDMDARMLGVFLQKEAPQTAALVLAHLDPQKFKEAIKNIPEASRSDILIRLAKLETVDADVLEDLNQALEEELQRQGASNFGRRVGGPEKVAKLLNALDNDTGRQLLANLDTQDTHLASQIKEHLFSFEDLKRANDAGIRILLQKVDRKDLLLSLKVVSQSLKEKILKNMSQRARDMLIDDLASQPKTPRADVDQAQKRVASLALCLRETGELTLLGDDEYV